MVEPSLIGNPHDPAAVRFAATLKGFSTNDYQLVMAIDINPRESAGGLSIGAQRSI